MNWTWQEVKAQERLFKFIEKKLKQRMNLCCKIFVIPFKQVCLHCKSNDTTFQLNKYWCRKNVEAMLNEHPMKKVFRKCFAKYTRKHQCRSLLFTNYEILHVHSSKLYKTFWKIFFTEHIWRYTSEMTIWNLLQYIRKYLRPFLNRNLQFYSHILFVITHTKFLKLPELLNIF